MKDTHGIRVCMGSTHKQGGEEMYRTNWSQKEKFYSRLASSTCAALALLLVVGAARAEEVAVALSGQLTAVDDRGDLLAGNAIVGQTFSGEYVFDSAAVDTNPDPTIGDYRFTTWPYGIAFSVGTLDFQSNPDSTNLLIQMVNDFASTLDGFIVRSLNNLTLPNGLVIENITWQLDDTTMTAIDSDALLSAAPVLTDWQQPVGVLIAGCNAAAFDGFSCVEDPAGGKYIFTIRGVVTSATLVGPTLSTLAELIAKVEALSDKTAAHVLVTPLLKAQRILRDKKPENDYLACDALDKFIEKVTKALEAGRIDQATADALLADALAIKTANGCPG